MTFRRCFVPLCLAVATGTAAFAQSAPTAAPSSSLPSAADNMKLQYANGIVAVAEDKIITVADVMREISPLLPQLQKDSRDEKDYMNRLSQLQDSAIQDLVDRVLIIKEFRKDEKRRIPESYVDSEVQNDLDERFEGDRSKFLAYLRSQGKTIREYRQDKEEEIIYGYMRQQQRKSQSVVSPVRIETFYNENKDRFYREDEVHLRMINLARNDGETDEALTTLANQILARLKAGEKFEDLAKEYSRDARRSKGGDWGWMQRSSFKPEFSDPAFNLKKGEVSSPILLPEGCYLLYAEDRHFAGIQPLDEVREQIERILVQQMTNDSQEKWLERLRRNGYVKHY
ncbi:MAG TPA: peptidylprolyl isomerase [Opitutaceae bacterium]|nr:peptidylprolyl isomerase [Opitutaceae bacterium]